MRAGAAILPDAGRALDPKGGNKGGKPSLRLPDDPAAVVVRLERFLDRDHGPRTVVRVHADGRVVFELPEGVPSLAPSDLTQYAKRRAAQVNAGAPSPPPKTRLLETRLSPRELEELMRFALHEHEFFDFDKDEVKGVLQKEYRSDGFVPSASDKTTTELRVQTAERGHELTWAGLTNSAWMFPKVRRLGQVHAVDRRLQQIFHVLLAGGPERVEAVVEQMNELLRPVYARHPSAPRLTADDLFGVLPATDGSGRKSFWFCRNKHVLDVRNPAFEVSVSVPPQGRPRLNYMVGPR